MNVHITTTFRLWELMENLYKSFSRIGCYFFIYYLNSLLIRIRPFEDHILKFGIWLNDILQHVTVSHMLLTKMVALICSLDKCHRDLTRSTVRHKIIPSNYWYLFLALQLIGYPALFFRIPYIYISDGLKGKGKTPERKSFISLLPGCVRDFSSGFFVTLSLSSIDFFNCMETFHVNSSMLESFSALIYHYWDIFLF